MTQPGAPPSELSKKVVPDNPLKLFTKWFEECVDSVTKNKIPIDPHTFTLATASKDGTPSARTLWMKSCDADGFKFFTDMRSRKVSDLESNPKAAMDIYWHHLGREIRVEGTVEKLSTEEADKYFQERSMAEKLQMSSGKQGDVIENKEELEKKVQAKEKEEIKRPEYWGGFLLKPTAVEFWQKGKVLNDRIRYCLHENQWKCEAIYP